MTVVVLALLIVMWLVVLTPALLKGRMARRGGGDSVKSFRRQINVIGRTAPVTITPAHRGRLPRPAEATGVRRPGPQMAMGVVTPIRPVRQGGAPGRADGRSAGGRPGGPARSRQLQRRRQVLVTLMASVVLTFLLGLVPSLRMVWAATGMCAVLLVGYIVLLARLRSIAAEREMKLAFLPRQTEPSLILRRSAN